MRKLIDPTCSSLDGVIHNPDRPVDSAGGGRAAAAPAGHDPPGTAELPGARTGTIGVRPIWELEV